MGNEPLTIRLFKSVPGKQLIAEPELYQCVFLARDNMNVRRATS
ncbi:hypothetical protein SAMD00020551_1788 [Mesobacillus selenatarsenatis SF-1]|uniref:Uncharacterized protein n=1 Tax=Mesobacillus selenatarsenatis (strain DSM 18680 / JCM 14380 / FERM P-15431 / SF-1) TaxID=1321606 RepID=A0A0A8X125_MESS1|nr:hypothetical protein SAMD00020551_1788 [Mesobacillus selenatarsenatis SF-1]